MDPNFAAQLSNKVSQGRLGHAAEASELQPTGHGGGGVHTHTSACTQGMLATQGAGWKSMQTR